jgi:hypothetical protein
LAGACALADAGPEAASGSNAAEAARLAPDAAADPADPAAAPPDAEPPQGPAPELQPPPVDGFKMGDFTVKPGGRVKFDWIRDFTPIGNEESFDVRTIPTDGSEGTNSNLIAKETRLSIDIRGPVQQKELKLYVETDFYGTSSALRLRHAYGQYGGLLAGQYWSTFVDEDNLPRTIDFESPTAYALVRQAQVRWTQKLAPTITWSAAIEDNKSNIVVPSNIPGKAEYPFPDIATRFRFDVPHGHVTIPAFLGVARFRPTTGDPDSTTLWGTAVSAIFKTVGKDTIYGTYTYGEGIGRYRSGTTAVPDPTGKLQPVGGNAFMGGYERFWVDRWSTNASWSFAATNDRSYYDASINKQLIYSSVNLLYWFPENRGWTGVEYLYGSRETFGPGTPTGTAHRMQYAVRFNLP